MSVALEDSTLLSIVLDTLELDLKYRREIEKSNRASRRLTFNLNYRVVEHRVESVVNVAIERSRRNVDQEGEEWIISSTNWFRDR